MIPVNCLQRGDTAWKWTKPVLTHSSPQGQHELFIQGPCLRGSLLPVAVSVDVGRAGDGTAGLVLLPLPPALSHHLHELSAFQLFLRWRASGYPGPFPLPSSSLSSLLHAFCWPITYVQNHVFSKTCGIFLRSHSRPQRCNTRESHVPLAVPVAAGRRKELIRHVLLGRARVGRWWSQKHVP